MIPKRIHYCWFGGKKFPKSVINCINTWKIHLSDYEFKLWDETNSPMNHPFVRKAYMDKKYAFVSDYVRLWALYNEGGIYLDTDMYVIKSFNKLLLENVFFGYETIQKNYISAGIIGAIKNNDFIYQVLTSYNLISFELTNIENIKIPNIITKTYSSYKNIKSVTIYPYDYFYPFPYEERKAKSKYLKYITDKTYAIHLWDLSWFTWKDLIIHKYKNLHKKINNLISYKKSF